MPAPSDVPEVTDAPEGMHTFLVEHAAGSAHPFPPEHVPSTLSLLYGSRLASGSTSPAQMIVSMQSACSTQIVLAAQSLSAVQDAGAQ